MLLYPECIICSQIKFSRSVFCKFCLKRLNSINLKKRKILGVDHYSLFTWTEEEDLFVRSLVYLLKGKGPLFFKDLAELFRGLNLEGNKVLISPSSSSKRQYNHALSFAAGISKLLKISSVSIIEAKKYQKTPRKLLTREERFQKLGKNSILKPAELDWVFVDDVLVSGSTLKSLIEIYGLPKLALTLVYRPVFGEEENYEEIKNLSSDNFIDCF